MAVQLYINGKSVKAKSSKVIEIRNPATLELIEQMPDCGPEDVNAAVAAAKAAQREWDKTPAKMERKPYWYPYSERRK